MKKILLATTMLVGTAGFAAAEVTLSGSAVFGIGYDESVAVGNDTFSIMETYLTATAAVQSDAGLEFGFEQTFATFTTEAARSIIESDGTKVYVSGAFGKLSFGSVSEADEVGTLADIGGLKGLGVDNIAEAYTGDSNNHNEADINYTGTFGGFTVALSTNLNEKGDTTDSTSAIGLKYAFGDAYVGLGYVDTENFGSTASIYAGGEFSGVTVKAMYSDFKTDNAVVEPDGDAYGLYAAYTTGALTLIAEVADNDASTDTSYGLGVSYDLGGGAAVVGGIASVDGVTKAEGGVSFEF